MHRTSFRSPPIFSFLWSKQIPNSVKRTQSESRWVMMRLGSEWSWVKLHHYLIASPCLSMEPPFSWNNIPVKPPKLLFFFTSPDTNLLQHQRHYLLMQDAESSTNYSRYPSKYFLRQGLCNHNLHSISRNSQMVIHGPRHSTTRYTGAEKYREWNC